MSAPSSPRLPERGAVPEVEGEFDALRAEAIRTRSRWIWAAAIVVWTASFLFMDADAYPTREVALLVRGPEVLVATLMTLWLRRPQGLRRLEIATIASFGIIAAASAFGLWMVPHDRLPMKVASLVLSVLLVCPLGAFTWQATASAGIVTLVALSGLPFRDELALYRITLTVIGFAYAVLIVSAFTRDRLKRREFLATRALARANERLQREDEARRRLFVGLSHDFRTPLAVIRADTDELASSVTGAHARESLERIDRNARALADMTEQILDLARIEAGQARRSARSTNILQAARDTAAQLSRPHRHIAVTHGSEPLNAFVDGAHVRRILSNVVANAVRQPGEHVLIEVRREETTIVVDITDEGPGIAPERREAIFQRFVSFDADGATTSGIGLPLARELAELNGGSLTLVDGPKTTFRMALPATDLAAEEEASELAERSGPTSARDSVSTDPRAHARREERGRVLLVEDNPDMALLLTRILGHRFTVVHAATTEGARKELAGPIPDAIVTDVLLPDGTGYDVLDLVRATRSLAHVPLLMVSALGEEVERVRGLRHGADDYLAKPFAAEELLARVDTLVQRATARKSALRAERDALLMEIHDGVSGSLARAAMVLATSGRDSVDHARSAIREGLDEVRALTRLLAPQDEDWASVTASIRRSMADACAMGGVRLTFQAVATEGLVPVTGPVAHTLRRVAREATTNVLKHSGATALTCIMHAYLDRWMMRLEDDGHGFAPSSDQGSGLSIMRRRVERLGGTLAHGNRAEGGAYVEATVARV